MRSRILSVVLAVAVASCGGDGTGGADEPATASGTITPGTDTGPPSPSADEPARDVSDDDAATGVITMDDVSPESLEVAEALTAAHGDTGGFVALVSAMERGYSIEQIVPAAIEQRLTANGTIETTAGGPESPVGARLGVLLLDDAGAGSDEESLGNPHGVVPMGFGRRPQRQSDSFEPIGLLGAMRETYGTSTDLAVDSGSLMIIVITMLAETGYSLDQIVVATVVGSRIRTGGFGRCWRIEGEAPDTVIESSPCSRLAFEEATGQEWEDDADEDETADDESAEDGSADDGEPPGELTPAVASFLDAVPDGDHIGQIDTAPNVGIAPISETAVLGKNGAVITWDSSVTWESGDPELCIVATTQDTASVDGASLHLSSTGELLVPATFDTTFVAVSGSHCDSVNLDPLSVDGDLALPRPDPADASRRVCTGNYCWLFDLG